MSNYESAPATKLLATACACCGRKLVDAVSVEAGMGPDCRAEYGTDVVADEAARVEANALVHSVAKKGIRRADAEAAFERLAALGFVVLAERIAKRFRATLTPEPSIDELRAEYRKGRADFCYDNATPAEIDAAAKAIVIHMPGGATPANFVAVLERITCPCRRCGGTGRYVVGPANAPTSSGECFRCGGQGFQDLADARRNRAYDRHAMNRAARAMFAQADASEERAS